MRGAPMRRAVRWKNQTTELRIADSSVCARFHAGREN
jgi:hypothetical protein